MTRDYKNKRKVKNEHEDSGGLFGNDGKADDGGTLHKSHMKKSAADTGGAASEPLSLTGAIGQAIRAKAAARLHRLLNAEDVPEVSRERVRRERTQRISLIRRGCVGILRTGIGFLLGLTPAFFGVHPFGLAYLCCTGSGVWFTFAGVMLSSLFLGSSMLPYAAAAFGAMLLRCMIGHYLHEEETQEAERESRDAPKMPSSMLQRISRFLTAGLFRETLLMRIGIAAAAASVAAIGEGMTRELPVQFIFVCLFLCASVSAFTYLFSGFTDKAAGTGGRAELGYAAFLYAITLSLAPMVIGGISIQNVFAFLVTLTISKSGGVLRGGVVGILCGMACDLTYAPLFAIGGLASGLLWRFGTALPVMLALLVSSGYAVYVGAFSALRGLVPDLICAAAVFYPLSLWDKLPRLLMPGIESAETEITLAGEAAVLARQKEDLRGKLDTLSGVLSKLSETFFSLSDRTQKPSLPEVRRVCENVMDTYCKTCSGYHLCWERAPVEMSGSVFRIAQALADAGKLNEDGVPDYLKQHCRCLDALVRDWNAQIARLFAARMQSDKTAVFAGDYENMAHMLAAAIAENAEEYRRDTVLGGRMQRAMERLDLRMRDFSVLGSRKKTIVASGIDMRHFRMGNADIKAVLESLAGVRYETPLFTVNGEVVTMTVRSVPKIAVLFGMSQSKKPQETVAGDVVNVFQNKEDYFYAMVSDGMGSGREASITAQLCAMFTEQMLMGGNSKQVTLEMLNHFLCSRRIECTTTVDLAEIDLINATASFVKSGAAPSYIVRDGRVYCVASNTIPVGIMKEVGACQTQLSLQAGDRVILVSDGIAANEEDGAWLAELLTYELTGTPDQAAKRIVKRAAARTGVPKDDLSAIVLYVEKSA